MQELFYRKVVLKQRQWIVSSTKKVDMGKVLPLPVVCPSDRVHQENDFKAPSFYIVGREVIRHVAATCCLRRDAGTRQREM